ncbi:MAG: ABC transporter permease [Mycobacteriales bacterium]
MTTASAPAAQQTGRRKSTGALLVHQVRYEQLSFWRNPQSAFFTFAFPVIFFVILGAVFRTGNVYDHISGIEYYTPTITALSVIGCCYSQLAISLSLRRQTGILKRLRATPAPAWLIFGGIVIHCIILSLIDTVLIVIMSRVYGHAFPSNWGAILITLLIAAAAFCAIGVAVASLIKNADAAPAVVQFIFFPLLFISGSYFHIASKVINNIAGVFPIKPFNDALIQTFTLGKGIDGHAILVMAAWGVGGALVAIRRFRWDPRPE